MISDGLLGGTDTGAALVEQESDCPSGRGSTHRWSDFLQDSSGKVL